MIGTSRILESFQRVGKVKASQEEDPNINREQR